MTFLDIFSKKHVKEEPEEKIKIIADYREKNSLVISELVEKNIEVEFQNLPVADYIIKETAVERKTVSDFLGSMISKRLSNQLEELKQYPKNLLVIEGIEEQELYSDKEDGINGNAVRGFLLSIVLEYKVPIIFTKDYRDTATFFYLLAKKQKKETSIRASKRAFSKEEQLQYIMEGFPGIGPKTAKKLLENYRSIKNIINTDKEELKKILGKKADVFKDLVDSEY